jgi:cation transport ATPase
VFGLRRQARRKGRKLTYPRKGCAWQHADREANVPDRNFFLEVDCSKVAEISREHRPFAHEDDEWKQLALLAAGCLVLGGLGVALDLLNHSLALICYAGAYVCGGWDAAKDAWERIHHARLDVHFLMLAVAAGAAVIGA